MTDDLGLSLRESFAAGFTAMPCYDNGTFYCRLDRLRDLRYKYPIGLPSERWSLAPTTRDIASAIRASVEPW